ncbi:pentatricopeptide repeat-containing protein At3g57430, chloroplastic-like [Ananas comosus]|uniref:Pentatricopeptide repeat-containing protein At3g57430, chloroplastic-like n=1 Tax=Ananas comosus TaxID=4615 RepID=A0A6P5EY92_ANACO|nr:pentatricopeptide repeat-containing protein At3g57430, chloroplastic-like [Ananas comosus]
MQVAGGAPDSVSILNLLPAICEYSALLLCREVHGLVIRRCLLAVVANGLVDTYCKCGSTVVARKVFDRLAGSRDGVSWGTMIAGYVYNSRYRDALELFQESRRLNVKLNRVSVVSALSAAAETADLDMGMSIHSYAVEEGVYFDVAVKTALVTMYAKCGEMEKAELLFDGIQKRDIIAWSAMVSAFVQTGCPRKAISLFQEMQMDGIRPNRVTLVSVLPACADLPDLNLGKSIHCFALKSKPDRVLDVSLGTALVAMYAKCGSFRSARTLFDGLLHKDVVTWNALINGYAQAGEAEKALQVFHQLQSIGQHPDSCTMVGVLPACALLNAIREGACMHGMVIKYGFESDLHVKNATIDMYAKCGDLPSSETLFLETKFYEDVISWNTMIAGYMHNGQASEAIATFHQMTSENIEPNLVSVVSVLPATGYLAALKEGLALHSYVIRLGFESHVPVGNCLIDMYSKCGKLDYACNFFNQMMYKDIVSWNVMLAGYALHGEAESAISLFSQVRDSGIEVDALTYLGALSACRHAGSVTEGKKIFESMRNNHRLEPHLEHYACMVDLLGRAGQLDDALSLIYTMPLAPDAAVWGALLGACKMHSNIRMGEIALENLSRLEPGNAAQYVVLSNIYAHVGRWTDARKLRAAMSLTGLNKTPGCSWVEIKNAYHAFIVGDQSHPQYESMRNLWNDLQAEMEKMGHVPDTTSVLQNVEEEEKEFFLDTHSERLAISFALLNTEAGTEIQIIKNLRVCGDCHTVTKLVSRITNRRIIVRDSSRFHHFENGICSCRDFW